jgi:chromosome segregation ATPase
MELKEVEREAEETQEHTEEIEEEVDAHKERAEQLEAAVADLRRTMGEMGSEELEQSISAAEDAWMATEDRLGELESERDELVARNAEIGDRLQGALEHRGQAAEKLDLIEGIGYGDGEIATQLGGMRQGLDRDMERLGTAAGRLEEVRQQLERIAFR